MKISGVLGVDVEKSWGYGMGCRWMAWLVACMFIQVPED